MDNIRCPKCQSTNVQKQASYAAVKLEGTPALKDGHTVPNECCEDNCRHTWFNEDV